MEEGSWRLGGGVYHARGRIKVDGLRSSGVTSASASLTTDASTPRGGGRWEPAPAKKRWRVASANQRRVGCASISSRPPLSATTNRSPAAPLALPFRLPQSEL
uniref:Uncharacterized protein n=1 Tax=Plectus sambesii TaxID=2011161 RepID=A0A914WUU6_9BILA